MKTASMTLSSEFSTCSSSNTPGITRYFSRLESRVTIIDGLLACAVLVGLLLNAALGWWWADPLAGLVIVYYAIREARAIHAAH